MLSEMRPSPRQVWELRVTSSCWEREGLLHGLAAASHQPLTQLLPSSTIIIHWRRQPGPCALFFRLWQLMLPRESLCSGSCGLGKTLKELIYNEQFPGLKTWGRERLGFILLGPLEVLKQDLCCLLAAAVFPQGIKLPAGKAFPHLPTAAGCRESLLWESLAGMEQRRAGGIGCLFGFPSRTHKSHSSFLSVSRQRGGSCCREPLAGAAGEGRGVELSPLFCWPVLL